eukprot:COSAG06_NODE_37218_length_437_cov_19.139053_1_plen_32_part_10
MVSRADGLPSQYNTRFYDSSSMTVAEICTFVR